MWNPCIEALAAALQYCSQQAWPLLLEQLTIAQTDFLAGTNTAATAGGSNGSHGQLTHSSDSPEVPQLLGELQKAMHSGDADQNGGCTDASVRLGNILKVNNTFCLLCLACCGLKKSDACFDFV